VPTTEISVHGSHTAWYPAERAVVTLAVSTDGPDRDAVFRAATTAADAAQATITPLHHAEGGPITWWSADSIRVWSQRPWNDEGKQLEPVHYAALEISAKFSDFDALGLWIEATVAIPNVVINGIVWSLTEATATAATVDARTHAVSDAVSRATVYAQSLGLATVSANALAEPGMLGGSSTANSGGMERFSMMKSSAADMQGGAVSLKPELIEVTASVDARFTAS
jgi:uncharacterized protein